jgi:integrase
VADRGSTLRAFLRYLHRQDIIATDLSRSVPRGRSYPQASIPRAIPWSSLQRVLEVVDRRAPLGKRDYAILLLLISYGLRAREISALQLEDIDWRQEQLHVSGRKGGHSTIYPLSATVGEAIIEYLRFARPQIEERRLFLLSRSPFTPLEPDALSRRAAVYLRAAGIEVPRPGSHTFRHSCVQHLVEADVPFKVIGDYVGHRTPAATQVYGKVALHKLRELALGEAGQLPDNPRSRLRGPTYETLFALLAGLGLRVGEVARLQCGDVDLERDVLLIRDSKFGKSRLVPFGPRLNRRLHGYLQLREREGWSVAGSAPLFSCGTASARSPPIPSVMSSARICCRAWRSRCRPERPSHGCMGCAIPLP